MWKHIALFEWQYRRKRPATYIYFGILFLISFLLVGTDAVEMFSGGQIKQNATSVIASLTCVLSLFCIFIISAIMGVSIVRDFEHRTEALFFTAPITKVNYLFGRFFGSFLTLLLVLTAIPLGLMLAEFMPWRDMDKLLPFKLATYWQPFFIIIVPNAFILSSLFFMSGALSRRMIVVFTQGMIVFLINIVASQLLESLDTKEMGALLDPLGMIAFDFESKYWTVVEKNTLLPQLKGVLLGNRLLWIGVGLICLGITYRFFSFDQVQSGIVKRKSREVTVKKGYIPTKLPALQLSFTSWSDLKNIGSMAFFYFRNTIKDLPFIALTFCGLAMSVWMMLEKKGFYDAGELPTTFAILEAMTSYTGVFCFILMILYAGNLVWMERDHNFSFIHDALPVSSASVMLGKYLGLLCAFIFAFAITIFLGAFIQILMGGGHLIQWDVYFKSLYLGQLPFLMIYMFLGFFVYALVNNKFAGHAIMLAVFFSGILLNKLHIEHNLLRFNSGGLDRFSDMNRFGEGVVKYGWLKTYWMAFTGILFLIGVLVVVRGTETGLVQRWRTGRYRLTKTLGVIGVALGILLISTGSFIYYNTNVLNKYTNSKDDEKLQFLYENTLKKFEHTAQPKITEVNLDVDLYPGKQEFAAKGYYILKNKTQEPIDAIHVQGALSDDIQLSEVQFSTRAKENDQYQKSFKYTIYKLDKPLLPNDSLKMTFKLNFVTNGFKSAPNEVEIIGNGTFFSNSYFPGIGYRLKYELQDDDERKEQGLKPRERMRPQTDQRALKEGSIASGADQIRFGITLSTDPDQIAIAPGYLQKTWEKLDKGGNSRKYFQYAMHTPMLNFYSIVSAHYAVKSEQYKGVNLEIYYHPTHDKNLDRMMKAMKASLDYYQENFGPYKSKQLRIMEFPRYREFAQSFENTIPFSEEMGFVMDIDDQKDLDMPFFVTAHETAHQWWGHQVNEADVRGSGMLSESLSEYSALMVMGKTYSKEKMQQFLSYELDRYLRGRSTERKKEQPLSQVEYQQYIYYNKGSHVLYALQDQIGEATLNRAIKTYLQKWNMTNLEKNGRYPTTSDLISEIRVVTPDSLQYLVTDLLETITLFDNKAEKVIVKQQGKQYAVTLDYSAQKLRADSLGNEKPIKLNDWVWIGVFGKDGEKKDDKLLYYQRYKINKEKGSVTVMVKEKPTKAGIDPLNILIDRHVKDNVKDNVKVVE